MQIGDGAPVILFSRGLEGLRRQSSVYTHTGRNRDKGQQKEQVESMLSAPELGLSLLHTPISALSSASSGAKNSRGDVSGQAPLEKGIEHSR